MSPQFRNTVKDNAYQFTSQSGYASAVLENAQMAPVRSSEREEISSSSVHSLFALVLSFLLALGTVFRKQLGGALNFAHSLELGNGALRRAHSGHPGDYVAWLSFGTVALGCSLLLLLH